MMIDLTIGVCVLSVLELQAILSFQPDSALLLMIVNWDWTLLLLLHRHSAWQKSLVGPLADGTREV